jgi:hypothetical protein
MLPKVRSYTTLSNESQLKHYTVGYVCVNNVGSSGPMFTKADIQTLKATDFTESDLLPDNSEVQRDLESKANSTSHSYRLVHFSRISGHPLSGRLFSPRLQHRLDQLSPIDLPIDRLSVPAGATFRSIPIMILPRLPDLQSRSSLTFLEF